MFYFRGAPPMSKKLLLLATALELLTFNAAAIGQILPQIPPSQIPRVPPTPEEKLEPPSEDRPEQEIDLPENILPPQNIPALEVKLFVSGFEFIGNHVLSDEQLSQLAQPYLNRALTASDLHQLRADITDLYGENGYTTSGAYIPIEENQGVDINAAVVTVQVIEGTVEEIEISGDDRLHRYVRQRLSSATSPALNQLELEEALRLLQIDPLIESISVNLSAGAEIGSGILSVQVNSQPNFQVRAGTDNRREPSAGSVQREVHLSASNLLAMGESFKLGYSNTDGSNSFNAGIEVPLNANNGTLSFVYGQLDGRIIEEPLNNFDIQADSSVYTLTVQQPLLRTASGTNLEEFSVGIAISRIESTTTLAGFPFPLSPGANNDGETHITELSLLQEYTRQDRESALLARSRFDFGMGAFGATIGAEPDGQYFAWRGQGAWLKRVFGNSQLSVRGDIQLTGDQLVPLSQLSLGGPRSIRGYRQDALIADSGLIATAKLAIPIFELGRNHQISLIPFVGAGFGWNNGSARALDESFLASVGLGAQYETAGFTARVNYAVPFTDVGLQGDSLQENGFDFELGYQLGF